MGMSRVALPASEHQRAPSVLGCARSPVRDAGDLIGSLMGMQPGCPAL